jgi:signal transduction histidine kinase
MTPLAFFGWLTVITSPAFGLFVLLKTTNHRIGRIWFAFTLSVAVWGVGPIIYGRPGDPQTALIAWRTVYCLGVVWTATLLYHFIVEFCGKSRRTPLIVNYVLSALFAILALTNWMFVGVRWAFESTHWIVLGPAYAYFFVWWSALLIYSLGVLWLSYPRLTPIKRSQAKHFGFAISLGFLGGSMGFLPKFGIDVYPWGYALVAVYPALMSMAIVRHQLMDVKVIVRKTFVYSIVTMILTVTYVAVLHLITRGLEGWVGDAGAYSSAAAAAAIALLFHPLRTRLQRWVDRRFPRESLDQQLLREATSGFVHEIKRPLANISMPAQLALLDIQEARNGKLSAEDAWNRLVARMEYIIQESIDAGEKMEALRRLTSAAAPELYRINLAELIERVVIALSSLISNSGVHLEKTLDTTSYILGNPKQLEIAFTNVIKNALEAAASKAGPRQVRLELNQVKEQVVLRVASTGPGIPAEGIGRIFEPFYTTKGISGMGIGLPLTREILRLHQGSISVSSELDRETTFTLSFPLVDEEQRSPDMNS